ncbi:hypothetical protein [Campylobacter sp. US33a]|uniref:hypothetical protein n=1 Tax=Campylobacter sp. US33a TaxID=2498120 RepID=UPI001067783B|nr:hypothetical protein [Campylobacter sp. US33a]TEY02755.1 hypothetical protein ELQ16_05105 [Campylobacter sp. US33a]
MPVSPIGNLNFVNQNAALPATQVGNELAKESFAALANLNEFTQKEKVVDKLEKVAKSHEINEEVKERADEEEKKRHKEKQDEEGQENQEDEEQSEDEASFKSAQKLHHLDISI